MYSLIGGSSILPSPVSRSKAANGVSCQVAVAVMVAVDVGRGDGSGLGLGTLVVRAAVALGGGWLWVNTGLGDPVGVAMLLQPGSHRSASNRHTNFRATSSFEVRGDMRLLYIAL
jgi:hypothetical protein